MDVTTENNLPSTARAGSRTSYRVLHVLDHSWPILSGYSIRSQSLVDAQKRLGHRPHVLTGPLHELDDQASRDLVRQDVMYTRTPLGRGRRVIAGRWPVAREALVVRLLRRRILALLEHNEFDLIHAHSPALCGLAAAQAAKRKNLPFVYEIRAFWEDAAVDQNKTRSTSLRYRASRHLEHRVARRADGVVGIATSILDELRERGLPGEKLFHISNGVDATRFTPQPRDERLAAELGLRGEPVFGFIGSLYRYEGISWLVPALAQLWACGLKLRVLIIGDGEDMPEIREAVRAAGAADYISLLGRVPHEQVQRYYSLMDVMIYPRRSVRLTELVTPLKPLEAMAQAKTVLASGVGGIRELVEHEQTGLLFRSEDRVDFCRQAERLIADSTLRRDLAERGRQYVLREKDWQVVGRKYEAVYGSAMERHRARG